MAKRKAPKGCYWRGDTLWARAKVNGIEHRWSLRTGSEQVALRERKKGRDKLIAESYHGEHRHTYDAAFAAWAGHIPGQVKPGTVERYLCSLEQMTKWLRPLFLDEIDTKVISEIVTERRGIGASHATIRRDLSALSSIIEYAIGEGWRAEGDNPALARMQRLKERRDPIVLPETADIRFVMSRASDMFGKLIEAAWLTGCRQDELVSAERRQVDHRRKQLALYRTKTSRPRVIDLTDTVDAYTLFAALPASIATKHLFWHGDGEPYANVASRFAAIVKAAQKAAQREGRTFRPFRFHDLRHRHAVDFLKFGGSLYRLQKRLGHASIKTTELYLDYLTPTEAEAAKDGAAQKGERV